MDLLIFKVKHTIIYIVFNNNQFPEINGWFGDYFLIQSFERVDQITEVNESSQLLKIQYLGKEIAKLIAVKNIHTYLHTFSI